MRIPGSKAKRRSWSSIRRSSRATRRTTTAVQTPWDYCCDADDLPANKAMVKIVDAERQDSSPPTRANCWASKNCKPSSSTAKAKRDEAGNLTVLADGIFVRN